MIVDIRLLSIVAVQDCTSIALVSNYRLDGTLPAVVYIKKKNASFSELSC